MHRTAILLLLVSTLAWAQLEKKAVDPRWECLGEQVAKLATNPVLISAVNIYNTSAPNPQKIDLEWPNLRQSDSFLQSVIFNPAADTMRRWILAVSIQGEGLLIGHNGGLVAATEKTTDFWQGDEAQFLKAIGLPESRAYFQAEMLDESTHLMLVKVSVPIYNPRAKHAVGVLVIGFDQFVIDFVQPCRKSTSH